MNTITQRTIDLAIEIQQIPAPTFDEGDRAAFLRDRFKAEGLIDVEMDALGNVFAYLPGEGSAKPVIVSAHSDTVFPKHINLNVKRVPNEIHGPGIGDNSLGAAGLFSVLWMLKAQDITLPGDLWLVANIGEEGLGDLKGMRAIVDRFGDGPLAYIVLEGLSLGQIFHRALGVQRYRISAHTKGGHSWANYGTPSAVQELASLVCKFTTLKLSRIPRTTLNVGIFTGGTSVNTIAAEASLELDLRSEEPQALKNLILKIEKLVSDTQRPGLHLSTEITGRRPAGEIAVTHPLVKLAIDALASQGLKAYLNIGSTDANIPLSRGLPCVCIGLTQGGGAHTPEEFIDTRFLSKGLAQLITLVRGCYSL
ncbi:MAG: M20/M25/M40 family metallo-hydrolase [Chloroflexi bacterium]|nr:M20/M25/M40 family metallo-hydrolase [Chloroflexota bacterium]